MGDILVIGSMNVDMTIRVKELPKTGETILARDLSFGLGGKGANQAMAAARLGGKVRMLGCVGDDDFGRKHTQALREAGVDVSDIKTDRTISTGSAFICVEENGGNCIVVSQGANLSCDEDYIKSKREVIRSAGIVLAQMEIPQKALYRAILDVRAARGKVILNPAPAPEHIPDEIYRGLDYLTPNETELMKLCGMEGEFSGGTWDGQAIQEGARRLLDKGVGTVIVTLGEKGCGVFRKGHAAWFPAKQVRAVDTTAAGDCFNAALAVALAEGRTEQEAVEFAICASSIAVTRAGAQESLPSRREVEAREETLPFRAMAQRF